MEKQFLIFFCLIFSRDLVGGVVRDVSGAEFLGSDLHGLFVDLQIGWDPSNSWWGACRINAQAAAYVVNDRELNSEKSAGEFF